MNLDQHLRDALQKKGMELTPSSELKEKVINSVIHIQEKSKRKNPLVIGLLVAALVIPTSAFAYQSYLADDFYGSFDNLKKHMSNITMKSYLLFDAKLSQAKGDLGAEEYSKFKDQVMVLTSAKLEFGDSSGNIDYDQLPVEKAAELKKNLMILQPYFDQLNGLPSSQELLSAAEFDQYIESLMAYEKILVQSGINPSDGINIEKIPNRLRDEFLQAQAFISQVDDLQMQ